MRESKRYYLNAELVYRNEVIGIHLFGGGGLAVAETLEELQRRVCKAYGAEYTPPTPGSKVGIALQTLGRSPIHAVRHPPTATTCGWYIFAGDEPSADVNFYQPLCVEHMEEYCRFALPFLALPPGWWFHTDGQGQYGASFDPKLLQTEDAEPLYSPGCQAPVPSAQPDSTQ